MTLYRRDRGLFCDTVAAYGGRSSGGKLRRGGGRMIVRESKVFRIRDFGLLAMCAGAVSWTGLEPEAMDWIRKMLQRQRVCMTDKSRPIESTFYRITTASLLI
jgi:hypothetical protein